MFVALLKFIMMFALGIVSIAVAIVLAYAIVLVLAMVLSVITRIGVSTFRYIKNKK